MEFTEQEKRLIDAINWHPDHVREGSRGLRFEQIRQRLWSPQTNPKDHPMVLMTLLSLIDKGVVEARTHTTTQQTWYRLNEVPDNPATT